HNTACQTWPCNAMPNQMLFPHTCCIMHFQDIINQRPDFVLSYHFNIQHTTF
ncbi:hypothetical protein NDU88_004472, partial [Pleurodeles waltl]